MDYPFYFTWSQQVNATQLTIDSVGDHYFITKQNQKIYDLSSVSFQASFGFKHTILIESINKQLYQMPLSGPKIITDEKVSITNKLLDYINLGSGKIFYTTSGAESVENALKMARQIRNSKIVLARTRSYHGATLGAISVTGDWRNKDHFTTEDWVKRIPEPKDDPDLTQTRKIIKEIGQNNIAAIILETITGANGVIIPSKKWWKGIQDICDESGILLILDEVICGFQRTGLPFGFNHFQLRPDFICLAKSLTAGMIPMGAIWTSPKIYQYYENKVLSCGLTNYAHPLGLAAINGVLELLKTKEIQNKYKRNEQIIEKFNQQMQHSEFVTETRSIGLLTAIELTYSITHDQLLSKGISCVLRENQVILAPAYNFDSTILSQKLNLLETIINQGPNHET
jgi:taurine---2-oxoglutarate transaminase